MSIYNIALYAAIAVISLVFAGGLYCFALILLKVPAKRTTNAIKSIASRNRPSAAGFKNTYNDIALFVSRFIHLNEFKKKELTDSLKIANIAMSPELFTARALVKSAKRVGNNFAVLKRRFLCTEQSKHIWHNEFSRQVYCRDRYCVEKKVSI